MEHLASTLSLDIHQGLLLGRLVRLQHRRLESGSRLDVVCYSVESIPLTFGAIQER